MDGRPRWKGSSCRGLAWWPMSMGIMAATTYNGTNADSRRTTFCSARECRCRSSASVRLASSWLARGTSAEATESPTRILRSSMGSAAGWIIVSSGPVTLRGAARLDQHALLWQGAERRAVLNRHRGSFLAGVGTAALGCPAGRKPRQTPDCKNRQTTPRRAALAWTAEGGCPYVN